MVTKVPTRILKFKGRQQFVTSNYNPMSRNFYGQINAQELESKQDANISSNHGELKKLHSWVNRQTPRCIALSSLFQYFENAPKKPKEVICMVYSCMFSFGRVTVFTEFAYKRGFYTNECFPTNIIFNSWWSHINHLDISRVSFISPGRI